MCLKSYDMIFIKGQISPILFITIMVTRNFFYLKCNLYRKLYILFIIRWWICMWQIKVCMHDMMSSYIFRTYFYYYYYIYFYDTLYLSSGELGKFLIFLPSFLYFCHVFMLFILTKKRNYHSYCHIVWFCCAWFSFYS